MITSESIPQEAYVWIWLPHTTQPVVAGKLTLHGQRYAFNYGKSYLDRNNAIALYDRELPLQNGLIYPQNGLLIPSCIRDASSDAWGRRVILNRHFGHQSMRLDTIQLSELTYLLESGSDRKSLSLTPAYDLCPQNRTGSIASQAMLISGQDRRSQLTSCLAAAHHFLLSKADARAIIEHQIIIIKASWDEVCNLAQLSDVEKNYFRFFLIKRDLYLEK